MVVFHAGWLEEDINIELGAYRIKYVQKERNIDQVSLLPLWSLYLFMIFCVGLITTKLKMSCINLALCIKASSIIDHVLVDLLCRSLIRYKKLKVYLQEAPLQAQLVWKLTLAQDRMDPGVVDWVWSVARAVTTTLAHSGHTVVAVVVWGQHWSSGWPYHCPGSGWGDWLQTQLVLSLHWCGGHHSALKYITCYYSYNNNAQCWLTWQMYDVPPVSWAQSQPQWWPCWCCQTQWWPCW